MSTYCESEDLLLGNVPIPESAGRYIQDAADEMDSLLGLRYVTPVILDVNIPVQRPAFLLLKRINSWLASGRLLMALDAAGEDDQVHQYAKRLVDDALAGLRMLTEGEITLPGAEPINTEAPRTTGPVASWGDDTSIVEAYDDTFGNNASTVLTRDRRLPYYGSSSPYTW